MEIKDVEKLAHLARIEINEAEAKNLADDMEEILGYVKQIESLDTSGISVDESILVNVFREDENPRPSGECAEVLRSAFPAREGDYLKVKKIL